MNIFSALCERIRRMFGPDQTPVSTTLAPRTEPIQPIVVTPAGNPVPPTVQQPAPVIEVKQETSQKATPAKTVKKPKVPSAPKAVKEPKASTQGKTSAKKKTN